MPVAGDIPKRAHSNVKDWRAIRNAIDVLNQRIDEAILGDGPFVRRDGTTPLLGPWDNITRRIRNTGVAEVTAVEPTTPATGVVWLDTAATGTAGMGVVSVATVAADVTLTTSQLKVRCDTTAKPILVTLPPASSDPGRLYIIKNIGSSGKIVTVKGNANETIDGGLAAVLVQRNESITIISDGSNWDID